MKKLLNRRQATIAAGAAWMLGASPLTGLAQPVLPPPLTVTPAAAPPAAPSAAEYKLSLGDTIRITVFQSPDLSVETRITEAGSISYPLLGTVNLVGLTVPQAEKRIADGLRDGNFIKAPQVSINVTQVRGNQVSVLGQVGKPGRYPLQSGDIRVSDILADAGGVLPTGGDMVVVVGNRDGKAYRQEIDMPSLFSAGRSTRDVVLQNGDVIWVERAPQIYVYGEVQRPGAIRLERGMTLMQLIAAGGGLTQRGTMRGIRVSRKDAEGKTQVITPALTDTLKADDVVQVFESLF